MTHMIAQATKILNQGGIIIFPTDTAFGIGCRIDKPQAIDRLFSIRKRPTSQATPVLVSSPAMALAYWLRPPSIVEQLMNRYWPGALTIVASCQKDRVPPLVRGGGDTLGIRMPNHTAILSLITAVGVPILGPSANIHGAFTPYRQEDLDPNLVSLVDFVYPGKCNISNVSTVIDCSTQPSKILRQGAVDVDIKKL